MKKLIAIIALMAALPAQADTLVIYRPYATDEFDCSYLAFGGTPTNGTVEATCLSFDRQPVADYVFQSDFEIGLGGWDYSIEFAGRELRQEGCYMVLFNSTLVILSCQ